MKDNEAKHREAVVRYEKDIEKLRNERMALHLELDSLNQANTQLAGHK